MPESFREELRCPMVRCLLLLVFLFDLVLLSNGCFLLGDGEMGGKWFWLLLEPNFFGETDEAAAAAFDDEEDGVNEIERGIPAPATTVDEVEADSFTATGSS